MSTATNRSRRAPAFDRVLITGASRGIGRALALALARPGALLHLSGRDGAALRQVAEAVQGRGGSAATRVLDVRDRPGMAAWIGGAGPLDLVIANAGVIAGTGGGLESAEQTRAVFATNLDGMLNTVEPALALMAGQPPDGLGWRGRIAVVASMAIYLPVPGAPAYSASKAAADIWVRASRPAARRQGIVLGSFCPGYVLTPMTAQNAFAMPGLMSAETAAHRILRGIAAGRSRTAFPRWMALGGGLCNLLPGDWTFRFLSALPGRVAAAYLKGPPGRD